MTAIWKNDGGTWSLLSPTGFPDEAQLHSLVEQSPQVLPLAGSPRLFIAGREVKLGSGYADLVAVEREGRVAIIEIKLARNAEARRAVVSQVLAYAAHLYGYTVSELETDVLGSHLRQRDCSTLAELVEANDQEGATTQSTFNSNLQRSLAEGRFRLVIVLDSAPAELVALAGYLEAISDKILFDLITVSAYDVAGSQVIVPQRVDPEHHDVEIGTTPPSRVVTSRSTEGIAEFASSIAQARADERGRLQKLVEWALELERARVVKLASFKGVLDRWVLLPKIQPDDVGLVTLWNDGGASIQYWRSVFERKAPGFIEPIETKLGIVIRQGNTSRMIDDELLRLLSEAYRSADSAARSAIST